MNRAANEASRFLLQKYAITVPDEWLLACVEYVISEFGEGRDVKEQVYFQWLHSDLSQLEQPCLPKDLLLKEAVSLNGKFCVQVNSFRDIAQPAYAQLQQLRGRELDEADEPSAEWKSEWKKKKDAPRRIFKMELTDGVTAVSAIEYQPIPDLQRDSMLPGCKLQLHGQILGKRGFGMPKNCPCILMLTAENVSFLGGSVDALMEQNSAANILEQQLQNKQKEAAPPKRNVNSANVITVPNRQNQQVVHNNGGVSKPSIPIPSSLEKVKPHQPTATIKPSVIVPPPTKQTVAARIQPFCSDDKKQYNNYVSDNTDEFMDASIRPTASTVVGSINASYQYLQSSSRSDVTNTTISASIQPTMSKSSTFNSRQIFDVDTGKDDKRNGNTATMVDDDDDDDENILRAVACVEEEQEQTSFSLDFNALPYNGLNDMPEPEPQFDDTVPFMYLQNALSDPTHFSRFVIKGFVLSTAGKLEFSSSSGLSLKVRIADSSATTECTLSQDILRTLLGFSAAEARKLHFQATANKDVASSRRLSEGLTSFKHRLASLSGLLTLERCPQLTQTANTTPYELVHFADLTIDDCQRLLARVDAKLQRR